MSPLPKAREHHLVVLTSLVLLSCLELIACGSLDTGGRVPRFRDANLSMQSAEHAIVAGQTTQAEVKALLGPANEIQFDSGFAVWVYRARAAEPRADRAEFVILFGPSGVVKKTRLRPAYAAASE